MKKGFTLIELLIVMFIISVLVTLAIGGYNSFRKMALIDLSADSLVSQINEMRDKVIHGTDFTASTSDSPENLNCYGLKFEKGGDGIEGYKMSSLTQKFIGKKIWNDGTGRWEYQGCSEDVVSNSASGMDSMVIIEKVSEVKDSFSFRFVPPEGDLEFKDGNSVFAQASSPKNVVIKLKYGSGNDDRYARFLNLDLVTGKVSKNKNE